MSTNFPTSLDSYTTRSNGQTIDASHVNNLQDATVAIERRLYNQPLCYTQIPYNARVNNRSFAHKACQFTPAANLTLRGVRAMYLASGGAAFTIQGSVFTVSTGTIATVSLTPAWTNTLGAVAVGMLDLMFASPVSLTSGTVYGLGIGFSSSAGGATTTTDLTIGVYPRDLLNNNLPRAGTWGADSYHISSFTPAVSTAVTTTTNDQDSGRWAYAVTPLFDWA